MNKPTFACIILILTTSAVLTGAFVGGGWEAFWILLGILVVIAAYSLGISLLVDNDDKPS
jgi:hypothetical protein